MLSCCLKKTTPEWSTLFRTLTIIGSTRFDVWSVVVVDVFRTIFGREICCQCQKSITVVYQAGIQTHNLLIVNRVCYPLDRTNDPSWMFLLFVNSANRILGKNDLFDRSHDAASIVASLDSLLDLLEKMKVVFESWSVPKLDQNCQMPKILKFKIVVQ